MMVKGGVTGGSSHLRSSLLRGNSILASAQGQSGKVAIYLEAEYHRIDRFVLNDTSPDGKRNRKGAGPGERRH